VAIPEEVYVEHYRGDSLGIVFRVWTDEAKTVPADLSQATVVSQLKVKPGDEQAAAEFDITTEDNECTMQLSGATTQTLPETTVWDCQVDWLSDATAVQTVLRGKLVLTQDVTRP
jgi:hypothetical protein